MTKYKTSRWDVKELHVTDLYILPLWTAGLLISSSCLPKFPLWMGNYTHKLYLGWDNMTQLQTHTVNLAFGDPLWVCLCADLCGFNILTDNPFKKKKLCQQSRAFLNDSWGKDSTSRWHCGASWPGVCYGVNRKPRSQAQDVIKSSAA